MAFGHILDVVHELIDGVVSCGEVADVGDGHGETGAREQVAERVRIGEGDDMGRSPLTSFAFGGDQTGAQFAQGSCGEDDSEEDAIGFEGLADLCETTGQIVDPVEG